MSETGPDTRKPLPGWSKLLIGLVSVSIFGCFWIVVAGTMAFKGAFEHSQEPQYIAALARNIMLLPEPLPDGYRYFFGVDLRLFKLVSIDVDKGKQQLAFVSLRGDFKDKVLLKRAYSYGLNTPRFSGRFTKELSKGSWNFKANRIRYLTGEVVDTTGEQHVGMVACMVDKRTSKTLLLYGVEPGEKKSFNLRPVVDLLRDVKGF